MQDAPPEAPRRPRTWSRFGVDITDDYAWLKDDNWQQVMKTPDVLGADIREYLEAENEFTEKFLAPTEAFRDALYREMRARIKEDDSTVPARDGDFRYYVRYHEGGQHPVFCRIAPDGAESVLIDGDDEARGTDYFRFGACRHSPDHRMLAWSADTNGSEYFTIRFRDTETGRDLDERIDYAQGDVAWANDGRTIFYTMLDDNHRPDRVMRHVIGSDPAADEAVYRDPDHGFYLGIGRSESGRFVVISAHDHTTSECHVIPTDAPQTRPAMIAARDRGVEYEISDHGDRWIILTNADNAVDFKIVTAPLDNPGRDNWTELVPHRPGHFIRSLLMFREFMVRHERVGGLPRLVVSAPDGANAHEIAFDEEAYHLGLVPGYEFDTTNLRFTYSSMTTPERVYDYDMASRARDLRKEQEIPSGHDPDAYVTRRIHATSHDGVQVPVSILHRRDTQIDGSAPLLLYGYGSYGISIPASFAPNRLSLVDRGMVYAIAHIRGGTDCGYQWYLDGKLAKKTNTFRDFCAAGDALIGAGYTSKGRIAIHGGSAGGLLVGAVANMRPDLLGAVVAEVPFVDVLNTISDAELPLTPPEWPEWGNPIEDEAAFRTILSYSPYDNVSRQAYPAMLITGGLTDPRVTYWEPAKWAAKLRALNTGTRPILLRINMAAGHGGAAGRFDRLKEVALAYGFILDVFGAAS